MKKCVFLFIFFVFYIALLSEPWAYEGNQLTDIYIGDQSAIYYTINSDAWNNYNPHNIGFGQTNTEEGITWYSLSGNWYEDPNQVIYLNVSFTNTGTWYYHLRSNTKYKGTGGWSQMADSFDDLNSGSITVSSLNAPTLNSVAKDATYSSTRTSISVTDANDKHVLIVRREGSDISWTPTEATAYNDGDDLGNNTIVIAGNWDLSPGRTTESYIDQNYDIKPGTTYYYKTFTSNNSYYSSGSGSSSVTMDALPKPSSISAEMQSDSKIKLEWTPNETYDKVMITARKGSDLTADPSNGTEYSLDDEIGNGTVIFKGTETSYTCSGLDPNSTYYFRFYTAEDNSDYYSATDINTTTSEATHDGNTYHSVEITGAEDDFSGSENIYGDYYLTWDDTYLYAGEFYSDFNMTVNQSDKFILAFDMDPGSSGGFAPESWAGFNFAANNDGLHKPDYIFFIKNDQTKLYNSGDGFAAGVDKSYENSLGDGHAEVRIPWSDLGGKPSSNWSVLIWIANDGDTWTGNAFPSTNQTGSEPPYEVMEMFTFGAADSGINPAGSGGATPLPVSLSSFSGVFNGEVPVLQWQTASEINNAGWNVYRSQQEDQSFSFQVNPELIAGQGTTSELTSYEFIDLADYDYDRTYYYWLESLDYSNHSETYGPISLFIPLPEDDNNSPVIPALTGLQQNYPNPFNPSTEISFTLDYNTVVDLRIYNLRGELVRTLLKEKTVTKDEYNAIIWDGKDETGLDCSSGIFFYQLESGKEIFTRRMLLIK